MPRGPGGGGWVGLIPPSPSLGKDTPRASGWSPAPWHLRLGPTRSLQPWAAWQSWEARVRSLEMESSRGLGVMELPQGPVSPEGGLCHVQGRAAEGRGSQIARPLWVRALGQGKRGIVIIPAFSSRPGKPKPRGRGWPVQITGRQWLRELSLPQAENSRAELGAAGPAATGEGLRGFQCPALPTGHAVPSSPWRSRQAPGGRGEQRERM